MLVKKQEYLEKQIEDQLAIIRQNGTKNKRVSLQALKRKKRLESQLGQNDGSYPAHFESILDRQSISSAKYD